MNCIWVSTIIGGAAKSANVLLLSLDGREIELSQEECVENGSICSGIDQELSRFPITVSSQNVAADHRLGRYRLRSTTIPHQIA